MSDTIDKNNKQIVASKKKIENLKNQESNKDAQLEKLKQEIAKLQKEKLDIRKKQNAEKRKNRTRAMIIFAGEVLKLFPNFESAEKEIYTLGEYQSLYDSLLSAIKNSDIDYDITPTITPPDMSEVLIDDTEEPIIIPSEAELKATTVSSDQRALFLKAWFFLKNLFSESSTKYTTKQINDRIKYYANSDKPSTIIDDYQILKSKNPLTIDDLMNLH